MEFGEILKDCNLKPKLICTGFGILKQSRQTTAQFSELNIDEQESLKEVLHSVYKASEMYHPEAVESAEVAAAMENADNMPGNTDGSEL